MITVIALGVMTLGSELRGQWGPRTTEANQMWADFLGKYVADNGGVDYVAIDKKGREDLKKYLNSFSEIDPRSLTDDSKKALYLNFYNAGMITNILRYADDNKIDISSKAFTDIHVKDLVVPGGNIWDGEYKLSLYGEMVHLDNIEHDLLRSNASGKLRSFMVSNLDPRIHAAVSCAALGCPLLNKKPYTPENVDQMLTENMKMWLNNDEEFRKVNKSTMQMNSIMIWYYSDFDNFAQDKLNLKGAGHYLATFIDEGTKDFAWKVKFLKENFSNRNATFLRISSAFKSVYDWRINDVRNLEKSDKKK